MQDVENGLERYISYVEVSKGRSTNRSEGCKIENCLEV
jgi:hypothetical protein